MSLQSFHSYFKEVIASYKTHTEAAVALKVSPQHISDLLSRHRKPGTKILTALNWEKVITYQPKK